MLLKARLKVQFTLVTSSGDLHVITLSRFGESHRRKVNSSDNRRHISTSPGFTKYVLTARISTDRRYNNPYCPAQKLLFNFHKGNSQDNAPKGHPLKKVTRAVQNNPPIPSKLLQGTDNIIIKFALARLETFCQEKQK